jgi:hypothetical protein
LEREILVIWVGAVTVNIFARAAIVIQTALRARHFVYRAQQSTFDPRPWQMLPYELLQGVQLIDLVLHNSWILSLKSYPLGTAVLPRRLGSSLVLLVALLQQHHFLLRRYSRRLPLLLLHLQVNEFPQLEPQCCTKVLHVALVKLHDLPFTPNDLVAVVPLHGALKRIRVEHAFPFSVKPGAVLLVVFLVLVAASGKPEDFFVSHFEHLGEDADHLVFARRRADWVMGAVEKAATLLAVLMDVDECHETFLVYFDQFHHSNDLGHQ